jgi:RNA polymerase sigma-B factor
MTARGSSCVPADEAGRLAVLAAGGSVDAKAELLALMRPAVGRMAARIAGGRVPRQDLEQAGLVGVLASVDGFDPHRGTLFEAYATRFALGEMLALARQAPPVHVSRAGRDLAAAVEAAADELAAESGSAPTLDAIAERAGLDVEQVVTGLRARHALAPPAGGDRELEAHGGLVDVGEAVEARLDLGRRLETLDERSQRIVAMRLGLELSQSEIAERLGISQMHVSRLLRAALEQLWSDGEGREG